ncbi:MAG: hypothetical protein ABI723_12255 [Bacteroidia bacterium]
MPLSIINNYEKRVFSYNDYDMVRFFTYNGNENTTKWFSIAVYKPTINEIEIGSNLVATDE